MISTRRTVCSKPWCKATFDVKDGDVVVNEDGKEVLPKICYKCSSQEDFVSWEEKKYEGERWDGTPHQFSYKIKKYF